MITKNKVCLFLLSSAYVLPTFSMQPTRSVLRVGPKEDNSRSVVLAAPYGSLTDQDKQHMKKVREGNVCVLRQDGHSVLVGVLRPCRMDVLHLGGTTIVGHAYFNSKMSSFLDIAELKFRKYEPDYPLSDTTGTIHTNYCATYEDPSAVQIGDSFYSWKDLYQGRGQKGEIRKAKNAIIERFGIKKRAQIDDNFFIYAEENKENIKPNGYEFAELGEYAFAPVFIRVQHNGKEKPSLYSICPMAENVDGIREIPAFSQLSLDNRIKVFSTAWQSDSIKTNPFFKQQEQASLSDRATYGKFPYVEI
jgi:hypothetical protein